MDAELKSRAKGNPKPRPKIKIACKIAAKNKLKPNRSDAVT